ncbi:hypothetical protein QQ045_032713 [Rhodiola kirilowii]
MVLDDCDVCMEYWVSNGSNMDGYRDLASNRHIPKAHRHPTDGLLKCSDSDIPQYQYPDVLVRPPPPPPQDADLVYFQSHDITIPEDPAMPTPPDQTSMPPAVMETEQNHHTSAPTPSVDSEEIAEYPHMTNRPDQTSMPPARKNKRMTSQNDHTATIPAFGDWGETTGTQIKLYII